jgi:hypothetical protein
LIKPGITENKHQKLVAIISTSSKLDVLIGSIAAVLHFMVCYWAFDQNNHRYHSHGWKHGLSPRLELSTTAT